jgi:hypothetical protein
MLHFDCEGALHFDPSSVAFKGILAVPASEAH